MEKYKNKYRIISNRMPHWDYSKSGYYFITLTTQHRVCSLSEVLQVGEKKAVYLSDFGNIVKNEWLKSFDIRKEFYLDEYVIMPNHLHAIIIMKKNTIVQDSNSGILMSDINKIIRQKKSLSSFIGCFKASVNSKIDNYIDEHNLKIAKYNKYNHFFQPNYYDHIIRNRNEYIFIKNYIIENPNKWEDDSLFENKHLKPLIGT